MRQKLCDHEMEYVVRLAGHFEVFQCTKCGLLVMLETGEDTVKPEGHV